MSNPHRDFVPTLIVYNEDSFNFASLPETELLTPFLRLSYI